MSVDSDYFDDCSNCEDGKTDGDKSKAEFDEQKSSDEFKAESEKKSSDESEAESEEKKSENSNIDQQNSKTDENEFDSQNQSETQSKKIKKIH